MTKSQFLQSIQGLYRVANMADSDNPERQAWVKTAMAGDACCVQLDKIIRGLVDCKAITEADSAMFYDTI